jgi:hypothetical protein
MGNKKKHVLYGHKYAEKSALYRSKNKEKYKRTNRLRRLAMYGLSESEYADMNASQHGVCAICKKTPAEGTNLRIDHDHNTGAVRGLLCHNCNVGIGLFFENIDLLNSASNYISKHK